MVQKPSVLALPPVYKYIRQGLHSTCIFLLKAGTKDMQRPLHPAFSLVCLCVCCFFKIRVLLSVAQASLNLTTALPKPPKCWITVKLQWTVTIIYICSRMQRFYSNSTVKSESWTINWSTSIIQDPFCKWNYKGTSISQRILFTNVHDGDDNYQRLKSTPARSRLVTSSQCLLIQLSMKKKIQGLERWLRG